MRISRPIDAHRLGLGAVYQDAELVAHFTVGENILLGNEPGGLAINDRVIHAEAAQILSEMGLDLDVLRRANRLRRPMQLGTLATLFHRRYKLIVLDEPTARLSASSVRSSLPAHREVPVGGRHGLYISHRLKEMQGCAIARQFFAAAWFRER